MVRLTTAPVDNRTGRPSWKRGLDRVVWWRVLVVAAAMALAAAAVERPYRELERYNPVPSNGRFFRWTSDGRIEYWRFDWDQVYLAWIAIGVGAALPLTLLSPGIRSRLSRLKRTVITLAAYGILCVCLLPPVSYTDRSKMPKPGESHAYQGPGGILHSGHPILPPVLQGHRFLFGKYSAIIWRRWGFECAIIIALASITVLVLDRRNGSIAGPTLQTSG